MQEQERWAHEREARVEGRVRVRVGLGLGLGSEPEITFQTWAQVCLTEDGHEEGFIVVVDGVLIAAMIPFTLSIRVTV